MWKIKRKQNGGDLVEKHENYDEKIFCTFKNIKS
jgi:hypothetical protein